MNNTSDSRDARWLQILPLGVSIAHAITIKGESKPMITDTPREALEELVANFHQSYQEPGLLVDCDHASLRPDGSTRAVGWVQDVQLREDGVYALVKFTPFGAALVDGGEYVNRSPTMDLRETSDGHYVPQRLLSLALTNTPAFQMLHPTCFRIAMMSEPSPQNPTPKESSHMDPKTIAEKLGVSPDLPQEEILAALDERLSRLNDLEKQMAEIEAADAKAKEETFMEEHKEDIAEGKEEEVREAYRANPDAAKALFSALKPRVKQPAKPAPTGRFSRLGEDAKTPPAKTLAQTAQERTRFVNEVARRQNCSFSQAWTVARAERPELFV